MLTLTEAAANAALKESDDDCADAKTDSNDNNDTNANADDKDYNDDTETEADADADTYYDDDVDDLEDSSTLSPTPVDLSAYLTCYRDT